jgi:hypothetical protein
MKSVSPIVPAGKADHAGSNNVGTPLPTYPRSSDLSLGELHKLASASAGAFFVCKRPQEISITWVLSM